MTPGEKRAIADFFHFRTVNTFLGKHPSKSEKKAKMVFLYRIAMEPALRQGPPGSWLMQMDFKFKDGRP